MFVFFSLTTLRHDEQLPTPSWDELVTHNKLNPDNLSLNLTLHYLEVKDGDNVNFYMDHQTHVAVLPVLTQRPPSSPSSAGSKTDSSLAAAEEENAKPAEFDPIAKYKDSLELANGLGGCCTTAQTREQIATWSKGGAEYQEIFVAYQDLKPASAKRVSEMLSYAGAQSHRLDAIWRDHQVCLNQLQ